jgi:hypothetical protein
MPGNNPEEASGKLSLLFYPEDGGDMLLQNLCSTLNDIAAENLIK